MRTIRWAKWLVAACLLGAGMAAHAEGGCPDGQYPVSGQGWQACYPIPGYDQQQSATGQTQAPPEKWVDHWGAIATYGPTTSLGTSINMTSRSEAEQTALTNCRAQHGSPCVIQTAYRNGCGAMIIDAEGKYYVTNFGATLKEAVQKAMDTCTSTGHQSCHAYYSDCSLPKQIQ